MHGDFHPIFDIGCHQTRKGPQDNDLLEKGVHELLCLASPFEASYKNIVRGIFESHFGKDNLDVQTLGSSSIGGH